MKGEFTLPIVLTYNNSTNKMERGTYNLSDPMPYANTTLTVREFRGKSVSNVIWTDRNTMNAWVRFRNYWNKPIYVGYAFRRIGEGGHANQSQHYAGTAFDVGQNLGATERTALWNAAAQSGIWTFVEPRNLTPTWVHFDKRHGLPACTAGGYPTLRQGSVGIYVCVLQDALEVTEISTEGVDGYFGPKTSSMVKEFQRRNGLTVDGVVGCATWTKLTSQANGAYRNARGMPPEYLGD